MLAEIALRTARIQLVSGVLSIWGRTPATIAMTAATLHQVCAGRYVLGLEPATRSASSSSCGTPAAEIVMILLPPGLPWPSIEATLRAISPAPHP